MSGDPTGRRDFMRALFRGVRKPSEDRGERADAHTPRPLRPPGALPEEVFLATCERCSACVDACPADAILPLDSPDARLRGTPVIIPSRKACVVCDDLACMPACPSGALVRLSIDDIRMGDAVVDGEACLRSGGDPCSRCVDACPLGSRAIEIDAGGAVAVHHGCVGCGVCEYVCPTVPKAIVVRPPALPT